MDRETEAQTATATPEVVTLNLRGKRLSVLRSTLCTGPRDSLLRRLFGDDPRWALVPQTDGTYFLDDCRKAFEAVVDYLRYGADCLCFATKADAWRAAGVAAYYRLWDMQFTCACRALEFDDSCSETIYYTLSTRDINADAASPGVKCTRTIIKAIPPWTVANFCTRMLDAEGMNHDTQLVLLLVRYVGGDHDRVRSRDDEDDGLPSGAAWQSTERPFIVEPVDMSSRAVIGLQKWYWDIENYYLLVVPLDLTRSRALSNSWAYVRRCWCGGGRAFDGFVEGADVVCLGTPDDTVGDFLCRYCEDHAVAQKSVVGIWVDRPLGPPSQAPDTLMMANDPETMGVRNAPSVLSKGIVWVVVRSEQSEGDADADALRTAIADHMSKV
jgi:hypothetical protein